MQQIQMTEFAVWILSQNKGNRIIFTYLFSMQTTLYLYSSTHCAICKAGLTTICDTQGLSIVTNQHIYQVSPYLSKFYFQNHILDFVLTFVSASYTLHVTMAILVVFDNVSSK